MMEVDGRMNPKGAEGFGRFVPDAPVGEYRDRSRALALLAEIGSGVTKESTVLMPILMSFLKHAAAVVVRQSIISGKDLFCAVLAEIKLQLQSSGVIERWLEEIWAWMIKFKDGVCGVLLEPGSIGTKAMAVKFLELYAILLSSELNDYEGPITQGSFRNCDISMFIGSHPILDSALLAFETKQCLDVLLNLLKCASSQCGSLTVVVINSLAAIGRKRPAHYNLVLSALIGFESDFESADGVHAPSIRYSVRAAFLGFLRCMHPSLIESREKLLWVLRKMNPGESTEQIIRQVDKMTKHLERLSRDTRLTKDDALSSQTPASGELGTKKFSQPNDHLRVTDETPAKRVRFNTASETVYAQASDDPFLDDGEDDTAGKEYSSNEAIMDGDLTAVEQMIALIGAMLAEGERGAESLEILISQIQPELLADIVITNMKHLSRISMPISNVLLDSTSSSASSIGGPSPADLPVPQSLGFSSQPVSIPLSTTSFSGSTPDFMALDSKRDPRRDPRRLDPRRAVHPSEETLVSIDDDINMPSELDSLTSRPIPESAEPVLDSDLPVPKNNSEISGSSSLPELGQFTSPGRSTVPDEVLQDISSTDIDASSPYQYVKDVAGSIPPEVLSNELLITSIHDSACNDSMVSSTLTSEQISQDLPSVPIYVELTDEQLTFLSKSAILRVTEDYKQVQAVGCTDARLSLISRLVADTSGDEVVAMLQKHIILEYQNQMGHELAMHVLYHLHAMMASELNEKDASLASIIYEKFLLTVAKSLRDSLPASDRSFSRLLGEVPFLPKSILSLLEELCYTASSDQHGKEACDGDRVTQGLGTVWSLILTRPFMRQVFLDIALKCSTHPQEEIRSKAIRLVANKLFPLTYASDDIEKFAKAKLMSLVDQHVQDLELAPACLDETSTDADNQDTSISGSQNSEIVVSEIDSMKSNQLSSNVSMSLAQRHASLFFALCMKKASLLQFVFDIYGRAPKTVKQSIHRHVPVLIRNLGSSHSHLLHIISDPPAGSENLLILVLQILSEEMTPSANLIVTVRRLYETKLKDAAILIPILSSLSRDEVLPIFPRLVDLPMEKFQTALARILEGSAHTGPALTPVEVLVAIHNIDPEKDRVPLKKVMDVCTACFEQRTVFTQQVLAKSLNILVNQTPLPLLFMRTVIQAIDAFPTLVDFVMEVLSKLVNKQIWKAPKLWVGFLKCASQTQPHSFRVLLQLPPQQLEIALNRHSNLRASLTAHANQPSIRSSLPRATLLVLGLKDEQQQASHSIMPTPLRTSETSSSVGGAALT